jgi:hypothetical protein
MREAKRGGAPSLGVDLDSPAMQEILNRPPPEEPTPSGRLEANRDGTYTVRDLTFTMRVDEDGNVTGIDDKPNFHFKIHVPNPKKIIKAFGHHVADWAEDPYGVATGTGHDATKLPSGDDKTDGRVFTIIDGGFDVTDAIMRATGQDPYAARKRAALAATFDERAAIHAANQAHKYQISDQLMLKNISDVWMRADLDAAAKREATFELWDECVETGPDDQVAAAQKARAALARWVQVHIPKGDPDAFTDDELAAFNARKKSHDTFAPYQ